jgi:hypothetical protein
VLIEFQGDRLTCEAAQALLDLADRGIATLCDVLVVGKSDDGTPCALDLADGADQLGGFAGLSWIPSGC